MIKTYQTHTNEGENKMQKAANKHISHSAQNLLDYLSEIAGKKIVTGQHTQTNPMEEIDYIYEQTGKCPALRGFELLGYSPNINYNDASAECLTEVYENQNTLDTALEWAKKTNGIVTFTFHWFSPVGGRDKSFYTEHTDFDAEKVLIPGTRERDAFTIWTSLQRSSGDSSLKISLFCGDLSTNQREPGSGGVQKALLLRQSFTDSCSTTIQMY